MIGPITPLGSNHASLRTWAAYSAQNTGTMQSAAKPVAPPAAPSTAATLATVPTVAKLEKVATMEMAHQVATLETSTGPKMMTCRCSLCSNVALNTIASPLGGKVIPINLTGALSEEESVMVEQLRQRDAEVRRHEQAHVAAAGAHAMGSAQYTYQVGPDGKRYAVGGEVQVDLSEVPDDPEATLRKAQQLQAAALAPSDPSGADRSVAMAAARMATEARAEIMEKQTEKIASQQGKTLKEEKSKETGVQASSSDASVQAGATAVSASTNHGFSTGEAAKSSDAGTSEDESSMVSALDFYA